MIHVNLKWVYNINITMKIFDKIKNFTKRISEIEYNLSDNKRDYLEIYERNLILEKEINARTNDLNQANQAFLGLQNILEMMNSSEPLSSVLNRIIECLKGELGYVHSVILQLHDDESGKHFFARNFAQSDFLKNINTFTGLSPGNIRMEYVENNILARALIENKILYTSDLITATKEFLPALTEDLIKHFYSSTKSKSLMIVPLIQNKAPFGDLMVFSTREIPTETELKFLQLFARQIEIAITITGLFKEIKKQAITDPLTGLYNRRYFEESITKEAERSMRLSQPFTLISLDLDYLKPINDKYGHASGDLAIKTIAKILKENARSIDTASRFGGEEFTLLLPGIDSAGGIIAAERIRAAIENEQIDTIGKITASIGVATFMEQTENIEELIELADQAMYKAKINGRNQVQFAGARVEANWQKIALSAFMDILSKHRIPISEETTLELTQKLDNVTKSGQNTKDTLFSVVDALSQTYNNNFIKGSTKSKVKLATELALALNLSKPEVSKLSVAMLLYDIGNMMLPEELFNKIEPLNESERKKIKDHPLIAAREILKPIGTISDIIPIIENHHENWDGTGYPKKIKGEQIPIGSQIILIVDAFFAMTSERPYRKALSKKEAINIIQNDAEKKWNKELVEHFVDLIIQ